MIDKKVNILDKGNIFIFISSSGKFESTLNLAKEAKLHGMIVISISSIENNGSVILLPSNV